MQLCTVHAEHFAFEARNPRPDVDTTGVQAEAAVGSCVVVFVAVESTDTIPDALASEATTIITDTCEQLKATTVALVPCPQLSDRPAETEFAATVLNALEDALEDTHRVPIGWDVAFDIQTKAHPFSIQQHRIDPCEDHDSDWFVYTPEGAANDAGSTVLDEPVRAVLDSERDGSKSENPELLSTAESLGLFDIDGPTTLLPRGVVVRDLLIEYVTQHLRAVGSVPLVADADEPIGLHSVFRDRSVSRGQLPLRVFNVHKGESTLAADHAWFSQSTVPELATLVADKSDALDEACQQAALVHRLLTALGLDYVPVVRVAGAFTAYDDWLTALTGLFNQPVLVEQREQADEHLRVDFVVLGPGNTPVVTPTVVVDDRSATRLDIELADGDRNPWLVRAAPAGTIEAFITAMVADGTDGLRLPVWLAPTQLRLIPIEPATHRVYCEQLASNLEKSGIRVDIDDRDVSVQERLSAGNGASVPYEAVIGDDELTSDTLGVLVRCEGFEREFTPDQLQERISTENGGMPTTATQLPRSVSDQQPFSQTVSRE